MIKLFILFVFCVSTVALGKSPLEMFDLPLQERDAVIDYCPPTGDPIDVRMPDGTIIRRPSYHSDDIGLSETDVPPYDMIGKPLDENPRWSKDPRVKKLLSFLELISEAGTSHDACDRVSVLYVARFIANYWPGTDAAARELSHAKLAEQLLRTEGAPLIKNARIEARNMLLGR